MSESIYLESAWTAALRAGGEPLIHDSVPLYASRDYPEQEHLRHVLCLLWHIVRRGQAGWPRLPTLQMGSPGQARIPLGTNHHGALLLPLWPSVRAIRCLGGTFLLSFRLSFHRGPCPGPRCPIERMTGMLLTGHAAQHRPATHHPGAHLSGASLLSAPRDAREERHDAYPPGPLPTLVSEDIRPRGSAAP
jgi:hypothetical protein